NQPTQLNIPQLPNVEPLTYDTEPVQTLDSHENSNLDPSTTNTLEPGLGLYFESTIFIINDNDAGLESDLEIEEASSCGDWGDENLQEILIAFCYIPLYVALVWLRRSCFR
ncbi:hypothetical protein BYT27DRAFT_7120825, partial [Phlegmacium glaucopus]